jgi:hypothetical protein
MGLRPNPSKKQSFMFTFMSKRKHLDENKAKTYSHEMHFCFFTHALLTAGFTYRDLIRFLLIVDNNFAHISIS